MGTNSSLLGRISTSDSMIEARWWSGDLGACFPTPVLGQMEGFRADVSRGFSSPFTEILLTKTKK